MAWLMIIATHLMSRDNMTREPQQRGILLAVTGMSPQVVTETLYALAVAGAPPWLPEEIHLITTGEGARQARLNLLSGQPGWFQRLCADYKLPAIHFDDAHIHAIPDARGRVLDDIRTPADNDAAADFITDMVRRLTQVPDTLVHASIAGGRKTMGFYLGYAMSLYGRPQDRLSHVLVSPPFESLPEFYYPTPGESVLYAERHGRTLSLDARDARVTLADIPFVRLRAGLPLELLEGSARFSQVVAAAQCAGRHRELQIDLNARAARAGGEPLRLSPQSLVLLVWLARRRLTGLGPVHCSVNGYNREAAREFLDVCRHVYGEYSPEYEGFSASLARGMDSMWLSPAKNRLHKALVRALGEGGAEPYRIRPVGSRRDALFELSLEPQRIHLVDADTPPKR